MQAAEREKLKALQKMLAELNEQFKRFVQSVEAEETKESTEPKLSLIEEFQQKYPGYPVPKFLKWAGSLPPNPPEEDKQVIHRAVAEHYYRK